MARPKFPVVRKTTTNSCGNFAVTRNGDRKAPKCRWRRNPRRDTANQFLMSRIKRDNRGCALRVFAGDIFSILVQVSQLAELCVPSEIFGFRPWQASEKCRRRQSKVAHAIFNECDGFPSATTRKINLERRFVDGLHQAGRGVEDGKVGDPPIVVATCRARR